MRKHHLWCVGTNRRPQRGHAKVGTRQTRYATEDLGLCIGGIWCDGGSCDIVSGVMRVHVAVVAIGC